MRFTFKGTNLTVSQNVKDRIEQKINRLSRLFPDNADVYVTFSAVRQGNKLEITIPMQNKRILRAEVTSVDMFTAIDEAMDILDRQLVKHKNRLKDKSRRDASFKEELKFYSLPEEPTVQNEEIYDAIVIEKRKHFPLKPMDQEEAVMEMELLGHTFFVFRNSVSDEINVVYKRHNGTYGLIDPNDPIEDE